jgi:hypothetical protein
MQPLGQGTESTGQDQSGGRPGTTDQDSGQTPTGSQQDSQTTPRTTRFSGQGQARGSFGQGQTGGRQYTQDPARDRPALNRHAAAERWHAQHLALRRGRRIRRTAAGDRGRSSTSAPPQSGGASTSRFGEGVDTWDGGQGRGGSSQGTQGGGSSRPGSIHRDVQQVRQDNRDIRQDRRDIGRDVRDVRQDQHSSPATIARSG